MAVDDSNHINEKKQKLTEKLDRLNERKRNINIKIRQTKRALRNLNNQKPNQATFLWDSFIVSSERTEYK